MPKKYVFGQSPWGRYFIEAMESLADQGRLDRGRRYAGSGAVEKLTIAGTEVSARVAGSYQPWYAVSIHFSPLPGSQSDTLRKLLEGDPMLTARIASGELPEAFLETLRRTGIPLLPATWGEMKRSCSCPDSGDPCKHEAAVYYILAQEIDRDPAILFRLRGVDGVLQQAARPGATGAGTGDEAPIPNPFAPEWLDSPEPPPVGGAGEDSLPFSSWAAAIPAFLPPLPDLDGVDTRALLLEFYHAVSRDWERVWSPPSLSEAEARSFAVTPFRFIPSKTGIEVEIPGGARLSPFKASLEALASSGAGEGGSASFLFLLSFARLMRSLFASCAFHPAVHSTSGQLRTVWKPALFDASVRLAFSSLEGSAPVSEAVAGKYLSRAAFLRLLSIQLLTEAVGEVRFSPSSPSFRQKSVFQALFGEQPLSVKTPLLRSLPQALSTRFAIFEVANSPHRFELAVKSRALPRGGEKDGERTYHLCASVANLQEDGRELMVPLCEAAASGGPSVLAFPAMLSGMVPSLTALGRESSVVLSEGELSSLVVESSPLLSRLGVTVVLPKELRSLASPRAVLTAEKTKGGGNLSSWLDIASVTEFSWKVELDGVLLDATEFKALLERGSSLIRFKGGFIRLEASEAARLLKRLTEKGKVSPFEALAAELSGEASFPPELEAAFGLLASGEGGKELSLPSGLQASLRPYQERGWRWMLSSLEQGFGAVLADDMGLGKTVQAIAVILSLKNEGRLAKGAIVITPATLITNWERELARFAPVLTVASYIGKGRRACEADILLTSYETWLRDAGKFADRDWDLAVLDEAHVIKNPDAKKSRAVKSLRTRRRIALSGTPVENNLAELWSIFDFAIPGWLGSLSTFASLYRNPIEVERSEPAARRLRSLLSPFLLRRLKTDRSIIQDLPEKVVSDEYASLSLEQAALYQSVVDDYLSKIAEAKGMARRGLVFALLTALKQVGNHPRNLDRESPAAPELSGKSLLLMALLETAFEAGERVLVFSQYVQMLEILAEMIDRELGVKPYVLHGGMSKAKRDREVDRFQTEGGPGVFLISLKAGGVGLNLTAASRVIHYDLWFNPAVENQATDRAFRIGQKRNVFVHRLITRDTLEEKIDLALKSKQELADLAVGSGESWVTELGTEDLRELVSLGQSVRTQKRAPKKS